MPIDRRVFLTRAISGLSVSGAASPFLLADTAALPRIGAMLTGSLIGDALGGPLEFLDPQQVAGLVTHARHWPPQQVVDPPLRRQLATSLTMHSYDELRPDTAAYGPWKTKAARGTITDDSRHKIVVIRALRKMLAEHRQRLEPADLARQFIDFRPHQHEQPDPELAQLVEEGLREYRFAARWILGRRDSAALPVQRLWSGISNCSGQMALLPLAAVFPGQPERAYRQTFALDFVDAPIARDITAAINAGLAAALDPRLESAGTDQRWDALLKAMRETDPYRMADVPFAGRPLHRWLDLADSIVRRSEGKPARLYRLLETEGKPVYFWDAHFTLLVPLAMLRLCHFDPLAAMHLTLDFGHDTDSYAQLLGAMAGAVHGPGLFPASMSAAVQSRLTADYGEAVDDWVRTLAAAADIWKDAV